MRLGRFSVTKTLINTSEEDVVQAFSVGKILPVKIRRSRKTPDVLEYLAISKLFDDIDGLCIESSFNVVPEYMIIVDRHTSNGVVRYVKARRL